MQRSWTSIPAAPDMVALLPKLQDARSNVASLLSSASGVERSLSGVHTRLSLSLDAADAAAEAVELIRSHAISNKALHARIDRAVPPALDALRSFSLAESLRRRLLLLSSNSDAGRPGPQLRLSRLLSYVDTVDRFRDAVASVNAGCKPAVQRLQEAVEFLTRTKATDNRREIHARLKSMYEEDEVDASRFEGLLDRTLVRLQDEFESILLQLHHRIKEENSGELASDLEIKVLRRIAETLPSDDCFDIFLKARYRRAAKALLQLNPEYLKTYDPDEIDGMEWEALETSISLWVEHLELAVGTVLVAERRLCFGVLADGTAAACFAKMAEKIMAVFFRFGEGVARSSKEPQKLFKMLDMFDSMDGMKREFSRVLEGEPCSDICGRFRELQKLLVQGATKIFWEFEIQIEGLVNAAPPPADGSVTKDIRYAVNYLKCLASGGYAGTMGRVLRTEKMWKGGCLSRPEPEEELLRDAVSGALDALGRNVESKRGRYRDKAAGHVFAMNAYWYTYMRGRGSDLAALVGEETMRRKYKAAAEEAAFGYQAQAWGPLVGLLDDDDGEDEEEYGGRDETGAVARGKMEAFMKGMEERLRSSYCIPDPDLREQMKEAVTRMLMPVYARFVELHSPPRGRSFLAPDTVCGLLRELFDSGGQLGSNSGSFGRERGGVSTERKYSTRFGGERRSSEGGRRPSVDMGDGGRRWVEKEGGESRWRRLAEGEGMIEEGRQEIRWRDEVGRHRREGRRQGGRTWSLDGKESRTREDVQMRAARARARREDSTESGRRRN